MRNREIAKRLNSMDVKLIERVLDGVKGGNGERTLLIETAATVKQIHAVVALYDLQRKGVQTHTEVSYFSRVLNDDVARLFSL